MAVRNIIYDKIHPKIKRKGETNHIILYALNAYGSMKRAEFISDIGKSNRMNKNTFHDHIRELKRKGYLDKYYKNREAYYEITPLGEDELSRILIDYELDFQTLLEIGERKNKNLINRLVKFFNKYQIEDQNIKIKYIELANYLTLDDKLKEFFTEDKFNRLLLFLILNHPKFYPKHTISVNNFIKEFNKLSTEKLSEAQINFFIEQVIDEKKYNIGFHKLIPNFKDFTLFFREKSDYGKYFEITVDSKLKELVHIKNIDNIPLDIEDLERTYNEIIFMLVETFRMFHPDLKSALYSLIDKYRRNVKEQIIKRSISKIQEYAGIIALPEKPLEPKITEVSHEGRKRQLLDEYEKERSEFLKEPNKISTISSNFESLRSSIKEIRYFHKESILRKAWESYDRHDYNGALEQIDKILRIEENPELLYWKAEILAIESSLKKYDEALEIIKNGIKIDPMPGEYNFYRLKATFYRRICLIMKKINYFYQVF